MASTKPPVNERIQNLEQEIQKLANVIKQMQSDIKDFNEAFEHSEDSLQRLRTTISIITSQP